MCLRGTDAGLAEHEELSGWLPKYDLRLLEDYGYIPV